MEDIQKIDADYKRLLGYKKQGQLTLKEREDRKHAIERFMRESLMWLNFLSYSIEKAKDMEEHNSLVEERNYHETKLVEYVLSEIEITK